MTTWPAGLLTALVTPLEGDGVDVPALGKIVDFQVDSGVSGLVIGGGTGEFGALSLEERKLLAEQSIASAAGRIPVVVQTGALSTRDAIDLSTHAQSAGAHALMVASPFGEPISWKERLHFYARLTAEVSIPVMIYNTPPSGLLTLEQVQQLAELPHVSAVKDSSGSPELMGDLTAWAPAGFGVYVGLDSFCFEAISGGATGAVFGTGNLIPAALSSLLRSVREDGVTAESRALWTQHIRPFLRRLEGSPNYVAACKAGIAHVGYAAGDAREPFLMPEPDEVAAIAAGIDAVNAAVAASSLSSTSVALET
jgi:4-hydroxy-tetrahydrodipicolinate synthase